MFSNTFLKITCTTCMSVESKGSDSSKLPKPQGSWHLNVHGKDFLSLFKAKFVQKYFPLFTVSLYDEGSRLAISNWPLIDY